MKISIVSVFKDLYTPFLQTSLVKRAQESGVVSITTSDFFDAVAPKERIDAPTFGPGAGMLIKPTVVEAMITSAEKRDGKAFKIFFSPQGKKLTQSLLKSIVQRAETTGHLMLIPARYEGMDARVEERYADEIVSVGDFVLMGGDLPAMMLLEGLLRLVPGVIGKQESVEQDSFTGPFVDYPEYTEPVDWHGMVVPEIVRSGNHKAIAQWRRSKAIETTVKNHFSWLRSWPLTAEQRKEIAAYIPAHYAVLMHDQVMLGPDKEVGTSSVMSIDIHDIARSSTTYGIQQFFVVTSLIDQQKLVEHFLQFWKEGARVVYNKNRHEAVSNAMVQPSLEATIEIIRQKEGKAPLVIATSARQETGVPTITYQDQHEVWQHDRPVLFVFGTAQGLADTVIKKADYLLTPLEGFTDFNHLSVRSAAAIIFDRWLGLQERR